jgi:predicted flap endonuclease-1-like 5' DNA nuclease
MTALAQYEIPILIIAVVIGLIVAFWAFRRRTPGSADAETTTTTTTMSAAPRPAPVSRPAAKGGAQGDGLADEYAAATENVAGEFLGIDAHPEIDGPSGPPDNLQLLKGVGPKLAAQLSALGVTRYDQLARLSDTEVALLDERMGAFRGRIARDRLVEQACYLERGDKDGFEAIFGKLGG